MDDYLSKPISMDKLKNSIEKWVKKPGAVVPVQQFTATRERTSEGESQRGEKPLDLEKMMRQWNGKVEFVAKILTTFEAETSSDLSKLETALAAKDPDALSSLAHRIKGASAAIGAERIRQLAKEIEMQGRQKDIGNTREYVEDLSRKFALYRRYLGESLPNLEK